MGIGDLKSMSVDELWLLHQEILRLLPQKLAAEKARLDQRLRELDVAIIDCSTKERRPYPPVRAKYRNPRKPHETWAGRGKQPRWITVQLEAGRKLEDFRIKRT
ncbi:H-NS family nucleoid-associated regulatory protein [Bradyrhizobium genosp. P]|uniref:H-NS histone family protein n=1 Tax=Bradyrhizobium genosp. P TaxID=83641 RepID=UPI003CEA595C